MLYSIRMSIPVHEEAAAEAVAQRYADGGKPIDIARDLNWLPSRVFQVMRSEQFAEALRRLSPDSYAAWKEFAQETYQQSTRVWAQQQAPAALEGLQTLATDSRNDAVRLKAIEILLRLGGALEEATKPVEVAELSRAQLAALERATREIKK